MPGPESLGERFVDWLLGDKKRKPGRPPETEELGPDPDPAQFPSPGDIQTTDSSVSGIGDTGDPSDTPGPADKASD